MNRTLHVAAGEERECVARVDSEGTIDGFDPAPLARRMVLDLQGRDRLTEKQGEASQVCKGTRETSDRMRNGSCVPVWPRPQSPPSLSFSSGENLVYFMYLRWSFAEVNTGP